MTETWRLFVALELPSDVRAMLADLQERLRPRTPTKTVRWMNPDGIHLTLKFLGDVPSAQRANLEKALEAAVAGRTRFMLDTGLLGCFPNTRRPRVVWVGIRGHIDQLIALRDAVEASIAPLGYPTEDRPFSPHLTLGRVQREANQANVQRLGEMIAGQSGLPSLSWPVTGVTLFRSELKPDGATYSALHQVVLS